MIRPDWRRHVTNLVAASIGQSVCAFKIAFSIAYNFGKLCIIVINFFAKQKKIDVIYDVLYFEYLTLVVV